MTAVAAIWTAAAWVAADRANRSVVGQFDQFVILTSYVHFDRLNFDQLWAGCNRWSQTEQDVEISYPVCVCARVERERERERETKEERQTDRKTERQRDRDRQSDREGGRERELWGAGGGRGRGRGMDRGREIREGGISS